MKKRSVRSLIDFGTKNSFGTISVGSQAAGNIIEVRIGAGAADEQRQGASDAARGWPDVRIGDVAGGMLTITITGVTRDADGQVRVQTSFGPYVLRTDSEGTYIFVQGHRVNITIDGRED